MINIETIRLITMIVRLFGSFSKIERKMEGSNTYEDANEILHNYIVPLVLLDVIILGMTLALIKLDTESRTQFVIFVLVFLNFILGLTEIASWSKRSKELYQKELREKWEEDN